MNTIIGQDDRDSTTVDRPAEDLGAKIGQSMAGMKIALPKEYLGEGVDAAVADQIKAAAEQFKAMGATVEEVSLPHTKYAVPAYYIIASSEASSNLQRFDGIRYGFRAKDVKTLDDVYVRSRSEGFGAEVKRRIMLGTFSLSAGFYDAYFKKAGQIRTLITQDFETVFKDYDLIMAPTTPTPAFKIGDKVTDPVVMYMNDILTISVNLAGLPAASVPAGFVDGMPVGMQLIGKHFDEATIYQAAAAFEDANDYLAQIPGANKMNFETTIGLEVHVELKTNSKMFSPSPVSYGAEPNTETNVIDWGFPGVLPSVNRGAYELGLMVALALHADITPLTHFDRKNYFYPDNPKAYQITQSEAPLATNGWIEIEVDGAKKNWDCRTAYRRRCR